MEDYFDDGCVHGAERSECRICTPEPDEYSLRPLWIEDNNDFPEALWLSNLPDSEYVLFEVL